MGDQAAHRNPRERVEQRKHRLEHRAADVLEIDVDAFRAGFLQLRGKLRIAVVKAIVEAEFVLDVVAFVLAAGDAHGARALDPGDLPDRRADRAGSGGDDDGLAWLRLADVEQPGIGGHAGHAEHANRGRDRPEFRIDLVQSLAIRHRMGLPAGARQHDVALGKTGIVGGDHFGNGAAFHHAADRHRRRIGRSIAHPAAHIGIERQPDRAQQNLALAGHRLRIFLDAEVRCFGLADRTRDENDAFGLRHGWFPPIVSFPVIASDRTIQFFW